MTHLQSPDTLSFNQFIQYFFQWPQSSCRGNRRFKYQIFIDPRPVQVVTFLRCASEPFADLSAFSTWSNVLTDTFTPFHFTVSLIILYLLVA